MSDDGTVLPQESIDALFKKATGQDIASAPAAAATATPPPAPSQPPPPPAPAPPPPTPVEATPVAPPPAPVPPTPVAPPPPPPPAPVASQDPALPALQATVNGLAQQMARLEASVAQLGKDGGGDATAAVRQMSQRLDGITRHLKKMDGRVDTISKSLEATPDYAARKNFTCSSCGSHGFLAVPLKCTGCGREGWWGWWPPTA